MSNFIDNVFDRYGAVKLRVREDGKIYTYRGECIAFIKNSGVFNYKGRHIGWWDGGILRDLNGNVVGFGENPTDKPRPILPIRQIKPIPKLPKIAKTPPIPEIKRIKPIKRFTWSDLGPEELIYSRGYND